MVEEGAVAPKPAAAVELTIKRTVAGCLERLCTNGEAGREASHTAVAGVGGDEVVDVIFSSSDMMMTARWVACSCQSPRYHAVKWH